MLKRAVQQGHSGLSIFWGDWDDSNCARHSHLPAQWHVETCHYLGEYLHVPLPFLKGVAKAALYCAHRTSTFLSCAFCEQEGHLVTPSLLRLPRALLCGPMTHWPVSFRPAKVQGRERLRNGFLAF